MNETIGGKDVETLRTEMQQLRSDFSAMTKTLKEMANGVGNEAYSRLRENAGKARERAGEAADTVTHSIEERPFTSVLVSFAIGLVLGLLVGRQR